MYSLIDIKDLDKTQIFEIFDLANTIKNNASANKKNIKKSIKKNRKILIGKTIANLFFENSTRTLISFELAATRLGADVINVNINKSSTAKGETLKDTVLTLQAMGCDAFVVRHSQNNICQEIRTWLKPQTALINAGDGNNQHPTQALLDLFTIQKYKKDLDNIKVSIIGDIKHSRVANSLVDALHILGNNKIHLFGPSELLPKQSEKAIICQDMQQALDNSEVIVMLRIQKERMAQHNIPDLANYHQNFGLNKHTLAFANPNCIVLHPGPINREVEISSEIADNFPAVILEQVSNGVFIRQAVLATLLN
ncbi:MAG TPA: aspartate carbamoyltransferase catalytic subunit [Oceanospirillales bacterium]|nr:aspartate carbamoyltransferase catalytic subunit [Oceanospirillales bacterium]